MATRKMGARERIRNAERAKKWRETNIARFEARRDEWYVANRDRILAQSRERYYANHEVIKARHREYYQKRKAAGGVPDSYPLKLKRKYGITLEEYQAIIGAQGGGCGICGAKESRGKVKRLVVDHCHKTGRVRGVLCNDCNVGIGRLQESMSLLISAARYLYARRELKRA